MCIHCDKVMLSPGGTTSNMRSHLFAKHQEAAESPMPKEQSANRFGQDDEPPPPLVQIQKQGGRSFVWEFFSTLGDSDNRKTVCCNLCLRVLNCIGGSTSSMRNHLFLVHSNRFDRLGCLYFDNKGCGSKSVYFQRIVSIGRYTNLLPHPLFNKM